MAARGAASSSSGSVREGLVRVACLRPVRMAGGDAAARHPVQAAAGFLEQLDDVPDSDAGAVQLSDSASFRHQRCCAPVSGLRRAPRWAVSSTRLPRSSASLGRRPSRGRRRSGSSIWPAEAAETWTRARSHFTMASSISGRLLEDVIARRLAGEPPAEIARAAQAGIAHGVHAALTALAAGTRRRHRGALRRCLPESALVERAARPQRRAAAAVDQPRGAAQRWRHQPGTGGAGGARHARTAS